MLLEELVSHIQDMPEATPELLAARLGVSTRTIRKYVKQFNAAMEGVAHINLDRKTGYHVEAEDQEALGGKLKQLDCLIESGLPSTPKQRTAYLLNDLLNRVDWVKIDDLAHELYVSRRTVSNDMRRVERVLKRYGLELEEKPYRGVRILGSESAKRSCWTGTVADSLEEGQGEDELRQLIDKVSNVIDAVMERKGFAVSTVSYQNLVLHVSIAIMRIRSGEYVPMEDDQLERLRDTSAYVLAEKLSQQIAVEFHVELPQEEIGYIALHLSGRQLSTALETAASEGMTIPSEIWELVAQMLETVYHVFGFDFRGDLELKMNLGRHIAPLSIRLGNRMQMKNPLLADIKKRYPLAYAMAADASTVLARKFGVDPSDDEIGYIALAFALALERLREGAQRKRILLVCASGAGTSRLLEYRFKEEFGSLLESVETCDLSALSTRDFSQIDYVFTTVPISISLPVPVQEIGSLLDDRDIGGVHRVLRKRIREPRSVGYFDSDLFFTHQVFSTKDEAISFLCRQMVEKHGKYLPKDFEEGVLRREQAFSTAFGNLVAMPHPAEATSLLTFAGVCLLDEPITWDVRGNDVRVIVLMAFSRDGTDDLSDLMSALAELLTDAQLVSSLLSNQSWETFERLLVNSSGDEQQGGG